MFLSGYRWLYETPRILHRDISLRNLMFRKKNGAAYGVLNDFDLSVYRDHKSLATSKQRTGTTPFMAMDLLEDVPPSAFPSPHRYRHDLESFFYVVTWIVCGYHEGKEVQTHPFRTWQTANELTVKLLKNQFVTTPISVDPTEHYVPLRKWVLEMRKRLSSGLNAQVQATSDSPDSFDKETLGGYVSFTTFEAILETPL
jgi:hypothetical protein